MVLTCFIIFKQKVFNLLPCLNHSLHIPFLFIFMDKNNVGFYFILPQQQLRSLVSL